MLEFNSQILEECRAVVGFWDNPARVSPAIAQNEPLEVQFAREILRLQQQAIAPAPVKPEKEAKESVLKDDPELDGTDGAHPAWWRGHDHTAAVLCQRIGQILDGVPLSGVCNEPWESTRKRLAELSRVDHKLNRLFVEIQRIGEAVTVEKPLPIGEFDWCSVFLDGAALQRESLLQAIRSLTGRRVQELYCAAAGYSSNWDTDNSIRQDVWNRLANEIRKVLVAGAFNGASGDSAKVPK